MMKQNPLNIVVCGPCGRMGARIAALITEDATLRFHAGVGRGDSLQTAVREAAAIIDFTSIEASLKHARIAASCGVPIIIGTTGFSDAQQREIAAAAQDVAIVLAPNMSVGVNALFAMVRIATRALGREAQVTLSETHHVHKLDKPSGTAKRMAEIAADAMGMNISDAPISIESIRKDEVIGDHHMQISTRDETITIAHSAHTRDIFARGAIVAAKWIVGKKPGLYDMADVLGLKHLFA